MNENQSLMNFIEIYKNVISTSLCDNIVARSKNYNWRLQGWSRYNTPTDKPLYINPADQEMSNAYVDGRSVMELTPIIRKCLDQYFLKRNIDMGIHGSSRMRMNKYETGTELTEHVDHIPGIFDGEKRGIPIMSVVGSLNDDFTGGDLTFYENYKIEFEKGDILIFPSIFLFPHHVTKVSKGTRYTFAQWFY